MSIFSVSGTMLTACYGVDGNQQSNAYDVSGESVFPNFPVLPVPSGDLTASSTVALPNLHDTSHGFTCTGLAYDADNDEFLVGDIGALQPGGTLQSQIVKISTDFTTVSGTIPLYSTFPGMGDVQGVTIDTSDNTIWFCAPSEGKIRHITMNGASIGSFSFTSPTGIAYSPIDNSLWVLNYANKIQRVSKDGTILETYDFAYSETLDQCFLDAGRGVLYITAGANYSSRNNIYTFDTTSHAQGIACTVDSYSVEGIYINSTQMIIVNDGYYHSATVPYNQVNIYSLQ